MQLLALACLALAAIAAPAVTTALGPTSVCTPETGAGPVSIAPVCARVPETSDAVAASRSVIAATHDHDDRYYTEQESDARFLEASAGAFLAEGWSAQSTGFVGPNDTWTAIPGLELSFYLPSAALVQMATNGLLRTLSEPPSGSGTCQAGFRYVVDGSPRGGPDWGQGLQTVRGDVRHEQWSLLKSETLDLGNHTIEVQTRSQALGGPGCNICAEIGGALSDHARCDLNLAAFFT